jgi:hypothetical protein
MSQERHGPLPAVKQLHIYLDSAVEQIAQDALREQETAAQHTWETEGGRPSNEEG